MSTSEPVLPIRERMRRETWLIIREAAYRLFAEQSFETVGIEDIAGAAGVSRATFFNYFPSKLAVIQDPAPGDREAWLPLFERPTKERLWDSVVTILVEFAVLFTDQALKVRRLYERSPELHAHSIGHAHPFYVDLGRFIDGRTKPGRELDSALLLNIALAVSDTTFVRWPPGEDHPFSETLRESFGRVTVRIAPSQ